ncbi:adenine nucleotide alpha hydrolase family protein [Flindersiella endophytica]
MDRMPRPLVVGVDPNPDSQLALRWAADEALRRDAPVRVVTAYERSATSLAAAAVRPVGSTGPAGALEAAQPVEVVESMEAAESTESVESIRSAREAFDDAVGYVRARIGADRVTGSFVSTRPAAALVEESLEAELVVVGSRSRSSLASVLLGSVSSAVAAHAASPVVVVRKERAGSSANRIVVGVDGSPESEAALAFAFEAADLRGAHLDVVYAWHPATLFGSRTWTMERVETERESRRRELRDRVEPFHSKYPGVSAAAYVLEGRPATLLAKQSETARLMVVGSRGHGGINGLLLGSVSQALLYYAQSTVAVIRDRRYVVRTLWR